MPLVDVNVRRVLSRIFWHMRTPQEHKPDPIIWKTALEILPRDAYTWNQALMDFGSLVCTLRNPACKFCPVKSVCISAHQINSRPLKHQSEDREPRHAGMPRRIWRGRIIERLRHASDHRGMSIHHLGQSIKSDFTSRDLSWMRKILELLEADGLITMRNRMRSLTIRLADK